MALQLPQKTARSGPGCWATGEKGHRVRAAKHPITTPLPSTAQRAAPTPTRAHVRAAPSTHTAHTVAAGSRVEDTGARPRPRSPPAPPRDSRWSPLPSAWTVQPGPPGRPSHRPASHRLWGAHGAWPGPRLSPRLQPCRWVRHPIPHGGARAGRPVSPVGPLLPDAPLSTSRPPFIGTSTGSSPHIPLGGEGVLEPLPGLPSPLAAEVREQSCVHMLGCMCAHTIWPSSSVAPAPGRPPGLPCALSTCPVRWHVLGRPPSRTELVAWRLSHPSRGHAACCPCGGVWDQRGLAPAWARRDRHAGLGWAGGWRV